MMKYLLCIALMALYANCTLIKEPWGDWSPCYNSTTNDKDDLVSCGGGVSQRKRSCLHVESGQYLDCYITEAVCNKQPCHDPYEEEIWSECSSECEGGKRSIEGVALNGSLASMEIDCHNHLCEHYNFKCNPVDIVIIMDSSGSIGSNWIILKQFIIDFIKGLQIESLNSRIGVITYSNKVEDVIQLGSINDFNNLEDLIWNLKYIAGGTHTSDALDEMKHQFESFHYDNHSMIGLVISDAMSNIDIDLTAINAQLVKDLNVTMLGIGIGDYDHHEMTNITSEPGNHTLFLADDFASLKYLIETITSKVCDPFVVKNCTLCETPGNVETCNMERKIEGNRTCSSLNLVNYVTSSDIKELCSIPCVNKCEADCYRCDFTKGQIWRPNPCNCHQYFICEPLDAYLEYRSHNMTCGHLFWDQESLSCIASVTGDCILGLNVTAAPRNNTFRNINNNNVTCPFSIYNGDDRRFWINEKNHTIIACPLGLFFNDMDSVCTCVTRDGVTLPTDICEDDILLHFTYEDNYDDVSCNRANAIEYGSGLTLADGKACFNGSSYLEVPFLRNWFSGQNIQAFSIEMNYTTTGPSPGLAGIVNNGDCVEHPSFAFSTVVNPDTTNDIHGQIDTSDSGVERSASEQNPDATWVHMVWVYNGTTLSIYKNSVLVSEVLVNGDILNTQVPLRIGTICEVDSEQENYFNGCIEDLKLWNRVLYI